MFPILLIVIVLTVIDDFFNALIFGAGGWLFLILFLGILFLITAVVHIFSIVSFVACLFQMIAYLDYGASTTWTTNLIYKAILLATSMSIFLYTFAKEVKLT